MPNAKVNAADSKAALAVTTAKQSADIQELARLVMKAEDTERKAHEAVANFYVDIGNHIADKMGISLHTFIGMDEREQKEKCILVSNDPMTVYQLVQQIKAILASKKLPRAKQDHPPAVDKAGRVIRDSKGKIKLDTKKPMKKVELSRYKLYSLSKDEAKQLSDWDKRRRELAQITVREYYTRLLAAIRNIMVANGHAVPSGGGRGQRTDTQKLESFCRSIINLCREETCTIPEKVREQTQTAAFTLAKRVNKDFKLDPKAK